MDAIESNNQLLFYELICIEFWAILKVIKKTKTFIFLRSRIRLTWILLVFSRIMTNPAGATFQSHGKIPGK